MISKSGKPKHLFQRLFLFVLFSLLLWSCGTSDNTENGGKRLFDDDWKFGLLDDPGIQLLEFDDSTWRELDLPHDWSIEFKPDSSSPSRGDGGYFPNGVGWYRKTFTVPEKWADKKVNIYFEGVYMNAEVFINGVQLGIQPYGYTSFDFDLTPYLKFGGQNVVAVRVDNSKQRNSRWYSGSGIYRHVWLEVSDSIHIAHWGVAITSYEVSEKSARISISTQVKNETSSLQKVILSSQISIDNYPVINSEELEVEIEPGQEKVSVQEIIVENPLIWSPDSPKLYQAEIKLKNASRTLDTHTESFGIRTIEFSSENGFVLNGKKTILNGGNVHHDNGSLGATAYDRAEIRKVRLLKEAGFNAVRTSHNPPSEAFLDACDSIGLLVIDESFDGWRTGKTEFDYASIFDKWWKHDTESMVLRDRNHPSVVLWSIGNEIIERKEPEAIETANMLANAIRDIDQTRPVTSAMTTWDADWEIFDPLMAVHDVAGYNYQMHRAVSDHKRVPSRIILQTESYPKDAFYNWTMTQQHDFIIGDFVWTAMDYLGESGIGGYHYPGEPAIEHYMGDLFPWHGAYCGDIDLTGWRKPISHYRSMLYNGSEKLYMAVREPNPLEGDIKLTAWAVWPTWESWTWPGFENHELDVEIYSRHPKVRLYLNEELIGEKNTTIKEEFKAVFKVPYHSGTLKAIGVDQNEKEVGMTRLQTAMAPSRIKLSGDRTSLKATGQDLAFVTVEIEDNNGVLHPGAQPELTFDIEGPGTIIAVDNGNLKDGDSYKSTTRKAWHGRAMAVVKGSKETGEIILKVTSPGLKGSSISITSE